MCLAVPGKIVSIKETGEQATRSGKVSFGGVTREVNLGFVPDAKKDDYVIVHAGIALNTVDTEEAKKILEDLALIEKLGRETRKH
jgi:hydrogenase expression/formation protein HypC